MDQMHALKASIKLNLLHQFHSSSVNHRDVSQGLLYKAPREKSSGPFYKASREKSSGLHIQKGCTLLGQLACFYLMDRVVSFPSLLSSQGSSEPISDTLWHIFHALIWHYCLTFLPLFFLYLLLHFILFFPPMSYISKRQKLKSFCF